MLFLAPTAVVRLAVVGRSLPVQAAHDALEDLSQDEAAARPLDQSNVRPTLGEAGEGVEGPLLNSRDVLRYVRRGGWREDSARPQGKRGGFTSMRLHAP